MPSLGMLQLLGTENLRGIVSLSYVKYLLGQSGKKNQHNSFPSVQALKKAGIQILEPVMNLEITVSEDHLSAALADLAQRRGSIKEIQSRHDNRVVVAAVPLAEIMVCVYVINGKTQTWSFFISLKIIRLQFTFPVIMDE